MPIVLNGSGPITGVTSLNTTVSDTEIGYLDGVTSAIQTQFNNIGTWSTWTPTWTNLTVGNGTVTARYSEIGKQGTAYIVLTFGSTTSISGAVSVTNPSTMDFAAVAVTMPLGQVEFRDQGTNSFSGVVSYNSSTSVLPRMYSVSGSYISEANNMTSTTPFTWTSTDVLWMFWRYHKA